MQDIRCGQCHRKLATARGVTELQIKCPRCGTLNHLKAPSLLSECPEHLPKRAQKCPSQPLEACSQA
ncbi:Com family DNA-binding transcriptional regulator [Pseudomonas anatoliensis]|uniref:Com family DNA-binding transcriptional regulator n=1 Tax=Pseudomonas anatoliensis TaxID=2710589 RepID=UPI001B34401E|nr:Com family DNA-binding transcriptional regulator [Pseudomonas anatoliensis]MBP5958123.1 Com family DNA-binding transcriptional regulator [Pseudomonas anatoliensis]